MADNSLGYLAPTTPTGNLRSKDLGGGLMMLVHAITNMDGTDSNMGPNIAAILAKLLGSLNVNVVGGQLGETLWTNDANVFRVRVDAGGTVTFVDPGTSAVDTTFAASTGFRPAGDATMPVKDSFTATAASAVAGSIYAVGDLLDHVIALDRKTGGLVANYWLNSTQGTILGTPPSGANVVAIGTGTQAVADAPLAALIASTNTTLGTLGTQTTLAAILSKLVTAPALDATVAASNTALALVHTDLAAVLAKIVASPALDATVAATNTALATLHADAQINHADLNTTIHTDLGSVLSALTVAAGLKVQGGVSLADPTTPANKATVAVFHNADNQALGGTAYGLLTGGVAQIVNPLGNVDRQRGAGLDGIPAVGLATAATNLVMTFKTTIPAITVANTQNVTPAAMSGTIGGVPWAVQVGAVLTIDTGVNKENVIVISVTATTFNATFTKTHAAGSLVVSSVYNQARDAAGEADGATGIGTSVAAEYEYNGGAPGNANFDRARSVQAKGRTTTTISAGGGAASNVLTVAAAGTLKAGMQVVLFKASTFPAAGSFEVVYVDVSYIEGTTTVPVATAVVGSVGYDTVAYDSFSAFGPGLNGFNGVGVGIEEEALWDPISGMFYIERAATADGMPPQNIVAENPALWNGASMDRAPGSSAAGAVVGGRVTTAAPTYANGTMAATSLDTLGNLRIVDAAVVTALGTDASGVTAPTGGAGARGWLSGIFAGIGTMADTVWNGVAASASSISILKYIATAATATGDNVIGRVKVADASGNLATSTSVTVGGTAKQRLDVTLASGVVVGASVPSTPYMDLFGGIDTGGVARAFLMDAAGRPFVNINGTNTAISAIGAPQVVGVTAAGGVYTAGMAVGGLLSFTSQPLSGYVSSVLISLATGSFAGTIDLFLFSAAPTGGSIADHVAFSLVAADAAKLVGVLHMTDLTASGVLSVVQGLSLGQPFNVATTTLYGVAVLRSAGVTLVNATDMTATLQVVR